MKKILFSCLFIFLISDAFAGHISGGEMSYVYLGPGTIPGTLRYQLTLKLYRDCNSNGAPIEPSVNFTVFNNINGQQIINVTGVAGSASQFIQKTPVDPCIADNIEMLVCFEYRTYTTIIDNLPAIRSGLTVAYQRCCRIGSMTNIVNSANFGATYFTKIPGNLTPGNETNTSPVFKTNDTVLICSARPITFDFSATDANGDSLVYSFYNAFTGGGPGNLTPDPAGPPPYTPLTYSAGYSAAMPLGPLVTINPVTGLISGTAPIVPPLGNEIFAVTVLVTEYRNGIAIGEHFKDLQIRVVDCQIPTANLNPVYTTCDGFTVNFQNNVSNNPVPTFFWDFGDPLSGINDTSILQNPSHTFTDTGVYIVKLVLNRGLQCGDSTTMIVRVYPEFLPGFINSAPQCVNSPVQFTDTSYFRYGNIAAWRWDFGDVPPGDPGDTSHLQAPFYSYANAGIYNAELVVTNDKGCVKTIIKQIIINPNPVVTLFPQDTAYCGLDSLQLTAGGAGTFSWTPGTNITGGNTATPLVYPAIPTRYVVTLTDALGCRSKDSLLVTPKFDLTNSILANPTTICEEDTLLLTGNSNYSNNISWQWGPAASVESPVMQTTRAYPSVNTSYTLTTTWGYHCISTANQNIIVKPLAIPNAGPDTALCNGQASIQLFASGGNSYQWTPVAGLSDPNIANPIASPTVTTNYTVAVGVTGCSRTRVDSMVLTVRTLPAITLTNDTLICIIDTLQINSTGTGNFNWTPNYMINNTAVSNPLVSPDVPTTYYVRLTDAFGCYRDDSVFVDVKTGVALNLGADTTICQTDGFFINISSDGLYYQWTPPTYLDFPNVKQPFATPLNTITYHVVSSIGKCQNQDDITINVVPYPAANAGPDNFICTGFNAQLNASGGSSYAWSPATFLSNTLIPNPISVRPTASIRYIVTVRDTLGCPKPVKDTVWVNVYPPVMADAGPQDTSVVLGQPLLLQATGADNYVWSPATWLNNPNNGAVVALPQDDIEYTVTATTNAGCVGTDKILVKVFKVDPDMYVPSAFTPNGDGNNDVIRPVLLGMKELNYFRVYNRWGELMFATTEKNKGWDGMHAGKLQSQATYVWMAEGITYKGETKQKRGYVVLIQ
jgi:gliding motility-associated-like protein